MTRLLAKTALAAVMFLAGWVACCIRRLPPTPEADPDRYWQGFADGELHNQLSERTPSLN